MHLAPLVPLIVGLTFAGVVGAAAREHHRRKGDVETFKFPSTLSYLMICISILFAGAPFYPGAVGTANPVTFFGVFWGIAAFISAFAVYLFRYRITIDSRIMTISAFFTRTIELKNIVRVKLTKGSKSNELVVSLNSGQTIHVSGLLGDFSSLTEILTAHASKSAQPGVRADGL